MGSCVKLLNAINLHKIVRHAAKYVEFVRQCAATMTASRLVEFGAHRPQILTYIILENKGALLEFIWGFLTTAHKYNFVVIVSKGWVFWSYDLNVDIGLSDSSYRQIRELGNFVRWVVIKCEQIFTNLNAGLALKWDVLTSNIKLREDAWAWIEPIKSITIQLTDIV